VFDSLRAQTLRDFEWLVVDDGSTDNTPELIAHWARTADFPVRYFRQDHSGKHIAHNLAVREAHGRFFLALDSDDACPANALERIAHHWETIPASERSLFCGVGGLCADQHGVIVGRRYPKEPFDVTQRERAYVYRVRGEKWQATLTEIMRRNPFPEVRWTNFVPEGVVWYQIAKTYKERCVNEVLRIYYQKDAETGQTFSSNRDLWHTAPGRLYYYVWLFRNDFKFCIFSPEPFIKAAVMLPIVTVITATRLCFESFLTAKGRL
jgi:glycosyltransferase involved in cell wall biosynthesis